MGICRRSEEFRSAEQYAVDFKQHQHRHAGTINGFNLTTGAFVGTLENSAGKPITINQLWAIEFGGGTANNGKKNQLYFTAGPNNGLNGLFGVIAFK